MMRIRRQNFTLLETLVAVSLISILLTIIFGFFRELSELNRLTEEQQKESFQMRYAETRLNYLFQHLVNENDTARIFYFFTQGPEKGISNATSLVFTFNNETRANPAFSDDLLARLYIDDKHRLCLAMWPLYSEQPHQDMQKEVLMENAVDILYEFYAAPERTQTTNHVNPGGVDTEKKAPEKDRWHAQEWPSTYAQMPSIIRLTLKIADNPKDLQGAAYGAQISAKNLVFAFVLPSSKNYIYYPPDS